MKINFYASLMILSLCLGAEARVEALEADQRSSGGVGTYGTTTSAKKNYHKRCQSYSRCFYSKSPVYSQSSSDLAEYVGRKIGFLFSAYRHERREKRILGIKTVWQEPVSGHAMVIKGFDGDRLHI